MQNDPDALTESALLARLADVNASIVKLTSQKEALEGLIISVREKRTRPFDVTRKNSLDRILIEDKVQEIISGRNFPVLGQYIFTEVAAILPNIKNSTFRSHLHRMKDKGIIKASNKRGFWILADKNS